jgi:hypothetical protein
MTIVIGVKTLDGAILAADCHIDNGIRNAQHYNKIQRIAGQSSELYLGMAGIASRFAVDRGLMYDFMHQVEVEKDDTYIDDIDSLHVLELDESENRGRYREIADKPRFLRLTDREHAEMKRLDRLWTIHNVGRSTKICDVTYVGLRRSESKGINLFTMVNGEYSPGDIACQGSGREYVGDMLDEVQQLPNHKDGLLYVSHVMNRVLEGQSTLFRGYTLVSVKTGEETQFAYDREAQRLDLDTVRFRTENFPLQY